MKIDVFATNHSHLLKRGLNVYTKQIKANSKNIANIDNPNYIRARTNFSEELKAAKEKGGLVGTHQRHILKPHYKSKLRPLGSRKKEQVNINQEMSELAENQIRYNFAANSIKRHYAGLLKSIKGRI